MRTSPIIHYIKTKALPLVIILTSFNFLFAMSLILLNYSHQKNQQHTITVYSQKESHLQKQLATIKSEYTAYKNIDQIQRNDKLEKDMKEIETTYEKSVAVYEKLLELKTQTQKTAPLDKLFSEIVSYLAKRNYASAASSLVLLNKHIDEEKAKIASAFSIPESVKSSNAPPGSGYSRQKVTTEIGDFLLDIVAGDLSSTRVIVDTASDATCTNNCPVLSLGDYVSRSGAYAGINGSYFCPESYPSCAGKTNSFDTLLMNKNKVYFNSDNNVYSTVPAVIFGSGWVRFVGRSLDWGRDTGVDGVIANQPLLLSGSTITFGGDGDPKKGGKGARSFVANKGTTVYIGVVYNATVAEVAYALKALGMEHALNLDSGGSTALWSGGYKVGPGRNIPNAILFVRK